jgi:hypothetical protein
MGGVATAAEAWAGGAGTWRPGNLPVGGVPPCDQGTYRGEGVTGDAAGPRQVPQGSHDFLVAEDGVHSSRHFCQLPEEVAAAVVAKVLKEAQLGVPWFVVDGRVQGQLRRVGQVQADPAIVARQGARAGPENFTGGHELVQHRRLVVGHPAGQDKGFPG